MEIAKSIVRYPLLIAALLLAVVAVGCMPPRIGVSWPALDTVTVYDTDVVFVAYNDFVVLVDPTNGTALRLRDAQGNLRPPLEDGSPRVWNIFGGNYEHSQFFSAPVVLDDETLLIAAYNDRLYEVDVIRSEPRNTAGIPVPGHVLTNIAASDEAYYLPLQFGGVVALESDSYTQLWRAETEEGVWATPLYHDGVVYFGSLDHYLYAVDAASGQLLWKTSLQGGVMSTPVYYEGRLYAGSLARRVFEIDPDDGSIVGEYATSNWVWGSPTVVDNTLYVGDLAGAVYALDISRGLPAVGAADQSTVELWVQNTSGRGIRPSPLVVDQYVIIATRDGIVYWLDRNDGAVIFEKVIEGNPEILSDILLLDFESLPEPLVVVGTVDPFRLLVAYTLSNGREMWVYRR